VIHENAMDDTGEALPPNTVMFHFDTVVLPSSGDANSSLRAELLLI